MGVSNASTAISGREIIQIRIETYSIFLITNTSFR
jgi:hypothetical protein